MEGVGEHVVIPGDRGKDPGEAEQQLARLERKCVEVGKRVASGIYLIQVLGELHTGLDFRSLYRVGVVW